MAGIRRALMLGLVTSAVAVSAPLRAANQAGEVRFEVASIKRLDSSIQGQLIGPQGDRFVARNISVRDLIAMAYQVPSEQISGGPAWIDPGPGQLAPAKPGPDDAPPIDRSGPSLSVAIEEQLGLRFRTSKGMAEHFTIVAVERPREN